MQICLPPIGSVAAWRAQVRQLAAQGIAPEAVRWSVGAAEPDLLAQTAVATVPPIPLALPRVAVEGIETALHHSDPQRFARAHALVLRLSRKELRWGDRSDPALRRLLDQERAVRREVHKMHGFVRFREVTPPGANRRAFAAWFEPEHPIVELAAPFFARRFGDMDWLIATPGLTASCEGGDLRFAETGCRPVPPADATEDLWRIYFAAIFNPARLMVKAMQSNMAQKYWKNLPEAELIPELIRTAPERVRKMHEAQRHPADATLGPRTGAQSRA